MFTRKCGLAAVIFICVLAAGFELNATTAAFPCAVPLSGDYKFGTAPKACRVSDMQSPTTVELEYSKVIFHERRVVSGERERYMNALYPVLRDTAKYYIHRRNPRVSPAEEEAFTLGFLTLAHQESVWTHYRRGNDGVIRYMRGDGLHGFGLMQIDDRSHAVNIRAGKGADLMQNIVYGLDIYYSGWIKSIKAVCVNSESNFKNRARAAWSAYNGGPRAICRWANRRLAASAPDNMYSKKYDSQAWISLISDLKGRSSINVPCMIDGVRPCAGKSLGLPDPNDSQLMEPSGDAESLNGTTMGWIQDQELAHP